MNVRWLPLVLMLACGESHGADSFDRCMASTECLVVPASCCGSCGAATRGDAIAVHRDELSAYRNSACGDGLDCPACFMEQDPTLVATCNAGRCEVVDVQAEALTECSGDADCRLRSRDCCECGGDTSSAGLIAIRPDAENDYMDLVCDEGAMTGCPECAPVYPMEAGAACDIPNGRCRVLWAR